MGGKLALRGYVSVDQQKLVGSNPHEDSLSLEGDIR